MHRLSQVIHFCQSRHDLDPDQTVLCISGAGFSVKAPFARRCVMTPELKHYPVVETVIDLFANWLKHRREIAACKCEAGDYALIARDLGVSPGELDELV